MINIHLQATTVKYIVVYIPHQEEELIALVKNNQGMIRYMWKTPREGDIVLEPKLKRKKKQWINNTTHKELKKEIMMAFLGI